MIVEHGYIDPSGRAWDISRVPAGYQEDSWVATSCDASGDAMEAETKVELYEMLEAASDEEAARG